MLSIYAILKNIATKYPDYPAIVCHQNEVTYKEFIEKVDIFAERLFQNGIREGNIVAVSFRRGVEFLVSIFSILKLGATYVPIDKDYPVSTVDYILYNSKTSYYITDKEIALSEDIRLIMYDLSCSSTQTINIPIVETDMKKNSAYIIYTSGSTGRPKGVVIRQESVMNIIENGSAIVGLLSKQTILFISSISFDMSIPETLIALCTGMKVVVVGEREQNNPVKLAKIISEKKIDTILITPSRLMLLLSYFGTLSCLSGLQTILLGAEQIPSYVLDAIKKDTCARIFNLYGPTETTAYAMYSELTQKNTITIGTPLPNVDIFIVDEDGHIAPIGVPGEIYITGIGVGVGYINNETFTKMHFICDERLAPGVIYKTGDYARRLENGEFEYMGRIDNQIKLLGHRIELEQIEHVVMRYPGVKKCAVLKRKDQSEYLAVYYTLYESIDEELLKKFVKEELPQYMVPYIYYHFDELPMNFNGKVDRAHLYRILEQDKEK